MTERCPVPFKIIPLKTGDLFISDTLKEGSLGRLILLAISKEIFLAVILYLSFKVILGMGSAKNIYYNGLKLDSQNELKFLLSIEDTHAYIYHPFRKYKGNDLLIQKYSQHYTPDFLIRDLSSFKAEIVEVKGYSKKDYQKRKEIIEQFLDKNGKHGEYEFSWVEMTKQTLDPNVSEKFHVIMSRQEVEKRLYLQVKNWVNPRLPLINSLGIDDDIYERFVRSGERL